MDNALATLIKISNSTGKDTALVQGGGGNTSVKTADGKYMYIKASGTALKDMNAKRGWRRLRLDKVLSIVQDKEVAALQDQGREVEVVDRLLKSCDDNVTSGARPSVEAHLHAMLDDCVIHLHPISVGAFVNAKNGKARIEKLFSGEKFPFLWVPYTDPGFMLARKIARLVDNYLAEHGRKPSVLVLEKHGLFVSADSPNTALRLVRKVANTCNSALKTPPVAKAATKTPDSDSVSAAKLAVRKAIFTATGRYQPISWFHDNEVAAITSSQQAKKLLAAPPLNPDELVYANGSPVWVEKLDADRLGKTLMREIEKGKKNPVIFAVKGLGLFVAGPVAAAPVLRDIAISSFFIRYNAARMGGVISLTPRQQKFINEWEAEAFRKAQSAGSAASGMLTDRIAVVTGGGSGIGRSLAIGLARDGAMVAIADMDTAAADETLAMIKKELPSAAVMVVRCNVADENNVREAFQSVIDNWGGLDILVNAAGVAPAFPLVDMPADRWRLALEVNLTGYFLMAKWAARTMIAQGIGGSIINISSKTGLEASKNNSAYNATKSGELHLARGWAMELGVHDIRVNSVCPGNVFEGSKIWNPAYIRECARKYNIKPEEVIPYYVSRTILNKEIKGQDIADTVVFLCSDRAKMITGQTIVTDAGQVFTR